MTREVVTVRETSGYKEILEALATNALSAVPVVDADGHVLGVVSEADLLHKIEFAGSEPHARLFERKRVRTAREKAGADIAKDLRYCVGGPTRRCRSEDDGRRTGEAATRH